MIILLIYNNLNFYIQKFIVFSELWIIHSLFLAYIIILLPITSLDTENRTVNEIKNELKDDASLFDENFDYLRYNS